MNAIDTVSRKNLDITVFPCNSVAIPVLYLDPAIRQVDFHADEMSNAKRPGVLCFTFLVGRLSYKCSTFEYHMWARGIDIRVLAILGPVSAQRTVVTH